IRGGLVNFTLETILIFVAVGVGLWLLSFVVEALRPAPKAPKALSWAPDIPVAYVGVGGCKLRYIKTGRGPNLVLLHTLRTQFDLFQKVIPALAKQFTVHALDYPGHGFSDIPKARYDTDFFVRFVEDFVDVLDLSDVTLCGVSIGGPLLWSLPAAAIRASLKSWPSILTITPRAAGWRAVRYRAG